MEKGFKAIVTLAAIDQMSRVFLDATAKSNAAIEGLKRKTDGLKNQMSEGLGMIGAGGALLASLAPPIAAFAELEQSGARLESVMMKAGGVTSAKFKEVNDLAEKLGNKLPGTTADLQSMMVALIRNGVDEQSILDGVGTSAANLAIALEMPYNEAAKLAAKLKIATGVSNQEMMKFMDTISRINQVGVEAGEMQYAFSRSAGTLKLLKLQGLEASKSVANLYAQLINAGASGETVGTGMSAIFNATLDSGKMKKLNEAAAEFGIHMEFVDKKTGEFKGIENMVVQFQQLQKLTTQQRAGIVQAFLGPGMDANFMNTLINNGVKGFREMNDKLQQQADLEQKVDKQLGTLASAYEALTGTAKNALAAIGGSMEKELKAITKWAGDFAEKIQKFADANPKLFKLVGLLITLSGTFLIVAGAIKVMAAAWGLFKIAFITANPILLLIAGLAALAAAVYVYWDDIVAIFKKSINTIKSVFAPVGKWFSDKWSEIKTVFSKNIGIIGDLVTGLLNPGLLIYKYWGPLSNFFGEVWQSVKKKFNEMLEWALGFADRFFDAGAKIVQMIADGIKSKIKEATDAIEGVANKVREYLPFSPAKKGPFQTLHQIKFTETFAQSIKPGPAVSAMNRVAGAVSKQAAGTRLGSGGGAVSVQFNPTIHVGAGGNADDIIKQLKPYAKQLADMLTREMDRQRRVSFS